MGYLLDTNTLIEAKKHHYAFGFCPAFWDWLDQESATGNVVSIEPVLDEIRERGDELTDWANARAGTLFLPMDVPAVAQISRVAQWVHQEDFRDHAKRDFLAKADPQLIAYAAAHGLTLATHEVHIEGEKKKVKIPTVCRALGIQCVRTFQMLGDAGARFVLER